MKDTFIVTVDGLTDHLYETKTQAYTRAVYLKDRTPSRNIKVYGLIAETFNTTTLEETT